jgi:predicted ArsR family transcriptional regulator
MWGFQNLEIIASAAESSAKPGSNKVLGQADRERSILETVTRRPCTAGDIRKILGIPLKEVNELLSRLVSEGKIETSEQERGLFYQVRKS